MNIPQFINPEGLSPTMAGWNSGVKQRDTLQNSAVARALQEAQAQNLQGRLAMDQAEHPLKLAGLRSDNEGKVLGNKQKTGQITDEENKRRQDATDNFFKYLNENPDDPEGAIVYSGVPRGGKFEALTKASPQERQQIVDAWRKNKGALEAQKATQASELRRGEQLATNADVYERERMKAKEATDRAIQVAKINAESRAKAAEQKALAVKGSNFEQAMTMLITQQRAAKNQWEAATTPEQQQAILQSMNEIQSEIDRLYQMWLQGKVAQTQQRQSNEPNIPGVTGMPAAAGSPTQMPTPGLGSDPARASQPSGVPGSARQGTTSSGVKYSVTPQ